MANQVLTPFDSMVSDNQLQIIKAAIPYLTNREQQFLSVYVKYMEFAHTVEIMGNSDTDVLSSCSLKEDTRSTTDMFQAIKEYCSDKEKEMIDLISNFISAYQMYHAYQEMIPNGKVSQNHDSIPNMAHTLKNILSPEQQSVFDTCMKLFPSSTTQTE